MNTSHTTRPVRRRLNPALDTLEDRVVMSAGQGSTFAIMPGMVATAGQVSTLNFKIDPSLFTGTRHGQIKIGIDVASATPTTSGTSTAPVVKPKITGVVDSSGHFIHIQHTAYNHKIAKANHLGNSATSAVVLTLKVPKTGMPAASYSVEVKGLQGTTGQYLVGFYLPGDVAGTGTVTKADLQTIKKDMGMTATNPNYNFDADVNRNGVINHADLAIAQQNLGASTKVSPVVSVNLDPASDPGLNRKTTLSVVHFAGEATPGASIAFVDQNGGAKVTTTVAANGTYNILVPLVPGSNTFQVSTLDGFGQSISGAISPVVYSPPSS